MKYYKVIFSDGDYLITGFNGDLKEAAAYYIGQCFNLGAEFDHIVKCVSVEEA